MVKKHQKTFCFIPKMQERILKDAKKFVKMRPLGSFFQKKCKFVNFFTQKRAQKVDKRKIVWYNRCIHISVRFVFLPNEENPDFAGSRGDISKEEGFADSETIF